MAELEPESTMPTRAFSGRLGRAIATDYVRTAGAPDAPGAGALPRAERADGSGARCGRQSRDVHRMQAWAGQSAALAQPEPAGELVLRLWRETEALLPGG